MDGNAPRRILITGGSSGVGAAFAPAYAADGVPRYRGGRDRERLEAVAAAFVRCQDVPDR